MLFCLHTAEGHSFRQHAVVTSSSSFPSSFPCQHAVATLQVRKQILGAFDKGTIQTRAAYIALEHEWMHLETLAYMLAQEQRRSFESSAATVGGGVSHEEKNGNVRVDSSSEDEVSQHGQRENSHGMSHSNGDTYGAKSMGSSRSNGKHGNNGGPSNGNNGLASASNGNGVTNDHYGVTDGTNGHMHLNEDHVTLPVSTLTIPAGDVTLGTDMHPTKNFVWDNEGPKQSLRHVSSFQMAACPVSNAEFYHFAVECNSYEEEQYWTAADMACLKNRKQCCPATWTLQVAALKLACMLIWPAR